MRTLARMPLALLLLPPALVAEDTAPEPTEDRGQLRAG